MNKIFIIIPLIISSILVLGHTNTVFGNVESNIEEIKIISDGDLYIESKLPSQVAFNVIAKDKSNNNVSVECDKISNSFFKVGKTTVRCMAMDKFGNEVREFFCDNSRI